MPALRQSMLGAGVERMMSKKRELYEKGMEQLFGYLEGLLQQNATMKEEDIRGEILSISSLRPLSVSISFPGQLSSSKEGTIFLLGEHYDRYDDILPESLEIQLLDQALDDPKEIDRYLTAHG